MNSRAVDATRVFAWPEADIAVLGAQVAVGILHPEEFAAADAARGHHGNIPL